MPASLNCLTISVRNSRFASTFHPEFEVIVSGASGTRVTCAGFTLLTSEIKSGAGYPSMLNSVEMAGASSRTSARLIWRSSGRGCTVIPSAPKDSMSRAVASTFGLSSPRAFRRVAILLILTLSRVIVNVRSSFIVEPYAN